MASPEREFVQRTFKVNPTFDERVYVPEQFEVIKQYLLYDTPPQKDQHIDTIVVLGTNPRTTPRWYKTRLDLLTQYSTHYPQAAILITGRGPAGDKRDALGIPSDFIEAEAMKQDAILRGVPEERIILEKESTNVKENVVNTLGMLNDDTSSLYIGTGFLGRRIAGYITKYAADAGIAQPNYFYVDGDVQNAKKDPSTLNPKLLEVIAGEWSRLLLYTKKGDLQLSDQYPFKPTTA